MINNLRTARQENGGFTLVELLIVIVVLGVLAGITVFGVANFKASAETAACDASLKTVNVAAQAYLATEGTAADSIADLTAVPTGGTQGFLVAAPVDAAGDPTVDINAAGDAFELVGTCS